MVAISVARLTVADSTPGVLRRKRSIRFTHDAHVIPSTGRDSSAVVRCSSILPGSIPSNVVCETPMVSDSPSVYRSIPGPWGPFYVAATDRGVVAVDWLTTEDAFRARLTRRGGGSSPPPDEVDADDPRRRHLDVAVETLEALLGGHPGPEAVAFDLDDRPAWDRDVLAQVARIPLGSTASYGDIARRVGAPRAARAVGGAVGRNPIGLLIPCHRVIAADGSIGGYGGGAWGSREDRLEIKRALLRREGVELEGRR